MCNKKIVGEDAANADHRVLEEANNNVWKMSLGFPPTREDSPFVGKLFPHLPRQTEDNIRERIVPEALWQRVRRGVFSHPLQWGSRSNLGASETL